MFANTPNPPYYAVIFSSQRTELDFHDYELMAKLMVELASKQQGFLGVESVHGENGFGITVSYWESLDAIAKWKKDLSHQKAQKKGKEDWYSAYFTRICKVERDYMYP